MTEDEVFAAVENRIIGYSATGDPQDVTEELGVAWSDQNAGKWAESYERCPACDAWVEVWELVDDDSNPKGGCDRCEPRQEY